MYFFYRYSHHRDLHSFPTRRSSDLIEDADALYNKEDYEAAIAKYKEAISYESASSYPVQRIEMAETELAKQKAANENLEAFNKLVAEGDGEVTAKNYKVAIEKYKEALVLFD